MPIIAHAKPNESCQKREKETNLDSRENIIQRKPEEEYRKLKKSQWNNIRWMVFYWRDSIPRKKPRYVREYLKAIFPVVVKEYEKQLVDLYGGQYKMRTTIQKYNALCDMELIQKSKYDINARVEMIIQEVQAFVKKCEDEARAMYFGDEKNLKKVSETPKVC